MADQHRPGGDAGAFTARTGPAKRKDAMTPAGSPSPFPGMDPYLEDPALWLEFHRQLVAVLQELLSGLVGQRYEIVIGRRRFLVTAEHQEDYLEIHQRSDDRRVTLIDVVSPADKTTAAGRE